MELFHAWNILKISFSALLLFITAAHSSLTCDGVDDFAETTAIASTFLTTSTGTIAVLIKPTGSAPADGNEVYYGQALVADSNENFGIYRNTATTDQLWAFNYDGSIEKVGSTFTNNTWIHLAWVHTGGNIFLYKDGTSIGSVASGNTGLTNVMEVCRTTAGSSLHFNGDIAAVTFWNVALTTSEIETLARSHLFMPALTRAPTGQWLFDECADGASGNGVTLVDRSGNGRTATIDDGANNTGATCRASVTLSYSGGAQ